jgi:hypothetical protein
MIKQVLWLSIFSSYLLWNICIGSSGKLVLFTVRKINKTEMIRLSGWEKQQILHIVVVFCKGDINVTRRRASVIYNDKMFWSSNRLRIFIQYASYSDAWYWTNTTIIIFDFDADDILWPVLTSTFYLICIYTYIHEKF